MALKWRLLQIQRTLFPRLPNFSIQLPEKYKGTVIEKWYLYWEGVIQDYTDVFKKSFTALYAKPLRTVGYFGVASFFMYASYNNPGEIEFRDQMIEYQNLFGLVGKPIRNPSVEVYLKYLQNAYNYGLIRRFSFGVFSIIWLDNYDDALGLYKARCSYLKPRYLTFYERIIDVGFLNKFWVIERKMLDYDVNPNEWIDFSKKEYVYRHRITA